MSARRRSGTSAFDRSSSPWSSPGKATAAQSRQTLGRQSIKKGFYGKRWCQGEGDTLTTTSAEYKAKAGRSQEQKLFYILLRKPMNNKQNYKTDQVSEQCTHEPIITQPSGAGRADSSGRCSTFTHSPSVVRRHKQRADAPRPSQAQPHPPSLLRTRHPVGMSALRMQ